MSDKRQTFDPKIKVTVLNADGDRVTLLKCPLSKLAMYAVAQRPETWQREDTVEIRLAGQLVTPRNDDPNPADPLA